MAIRKKQEYRMGKAGFYRNPDVGFLRGILELIRDHDAITLNKKGYGVDYFGGDMHVSAHYLSIANQKDNIRLNFNINNYPGESKSLSDLLENPPYNESCFMQWSIKDLVINLQSSFKEENHYFLRLDKHKPRYSSLRKAGAVFCGAALISTSAFSLSVLFSTPFAAALFDGIRVIYNSDKYVIRVSLPDYKEVKNKQGSIIWS